MAQKQGSAGLEAQPVLFLPIPGQIAPGREGKLLRTLAPWKSPQSRATREQSPGDARWEDGCRWTGSFSHAAPAGGPHLNWPPAQSSRLPGWGGGSPFLGLPPPSPLLRARAKGWPQAGGGHDVTSRWWGARWTPTPTHRSPRAARPFSPCRRSPARFPLSLRSPGFATRRRSVGDSETRSPGGGEATQPQAPGPLGGDVRLHAGAPRARAPSPRPRRRRSTPPSPRGWHPGRHPPRAAPIPAPHPLSPAPTRARASQGRTHPAPHPAWPRTHADRPRPWAHPPGPHLPGAPQSAHLVFPGRCSSSRTALRRSLAMAAMLAARDAGPGPERPPRRARAPRRLPAARGPAPSWAASVRAPVPHSCRRARLRRRRRRWCLRRGRRACAGAGPGAHGALWPARPAGGPQRRGRAGGRAGGLLPRPTRPPARALQDQPQGLPAAHPHLSAAPPATPVGGLNRPGGAPPRGAGGGEQVLETYCVQGSTPGAVGVLGMLAEGRRGTSSHRPCPREESASRPHQLWGLRPQRDRTVGVPMPRMKPHCFRRPGTQE